MTAPVVVAYDEPQAVDGYLVEVVPPVLAIVGFALIVVFHGSAVDWA
jgi:hypothetical protein